MAEIKTETTMEEFMTKDRANYYIGITSITVNGKAAYELKGKFLDDLRDNALIGTNGEDTTYEDYENKLNNEVDEPWSEDGVPYEIYGKLKEEALKNKAIMEGIIKDGDNESSNKGWRRWNVYENTNHGHEEREYEMEHEDKERCELFDDHERPDLAGKKSTMFL
nr:hypothetical protein [Tanacetum cinerariifolium]